jgi:chemotaxis response regulator CheB
VVRAEFPVIAIGASAGALDAVRHITEALLRNCAAAVVLVFHVGTMRSQLPEILSWHGKMPVRFAEDGASLEPGPGRIRLPRDFGKALKPARLRNSSGFRHGSGQRPSGVR